MMQPGFSRVSERHEVRTSSITFFFRLMIRSDAVDRKLEADEYVEEMKKKGLRVPGIGHRIKSANNKDTRVLLLIEYADVACQWRRTNMVVDAATRKKSSRRAASSTLLYK